MKFVKEQLHKHEANRVGHHLISKASNRKIIDLYFKHDNNGIVKNIIATVLDRDTAFGTDKTDTSLLDIYVLKQACGQSVCGQVPYDQNKPVYLVNHAKQGVIEFDKNGLIFGYTNGGATIEDTDHSRVKIIHLNKQDSTGKIFESIQEVREIQESGESTRNKEFYRQQAVFKAWK